ncbi:EsaB/YukD family protein [Streptococcus macacae]|uniref:Type VII secretion protein, YukD family n=1 Tax=Streptococcus macacae NCTC 11558 TaxID=764298 RepID=G5JX82_9STRE|nr:type VII secretion protein, YukD family [Streptococcus macacae NCTC 11558]SUN77855.1 Putative secretion accessory protein EsaB/YukD [Streptococcus macacae NCTC 11558]
MPFINISFDLGQQAVDLRIPTKVTVKQLSHELSQIFKIPKAEHAYQLVVVNKGLLLSETALLADYPITTGDYLRLEEL